MSERESLTNFFLSEAVSTLRKASVFSILALMLLVVNNIIGFTYYREAEKKVAIIYDITKILEYKEIDSITRFQLEDFRSSILSRQSLVSNRYSSRIPKYNQHIVNTSPNPIISTSDPILITENPNPISEKSPTTPINTLNIIDIKLLISSSLFFFVLFVWMFIDVVRDKGNTFKSRYYKIEYMIVTALYLLLQFGAIAFFSYLLFWALFQTPLLGLWWLTYITIFLSTAVAVAAYIGWGIIKEKKKHPNLN